MIDTSIARPRQGRPPGQPKTGGRKKGTPNKVRSKQALERDALTLAGEGESPLAFLLRVMRDKANALDVRINAAKAAAPYCHRILKAVDVSGHVTHGISKELADFIAGNAGAARSFLDFDREDPEPEAAADDGAVSDHR